MLVLAPDVAQTKTGMDHSDEVESHVTARERETVTPPMPRTKGGVQETEMMTLLRAMDARMDKLEESDSKLEETLSRKKNGLRVDTFMTLRQPVHLLHGNGRAHAHRLTGWATKVTADDDATAKTCSTSTQRSKHSREHKQEQRKEYLQFIHHVKAKPDKVKADTGIGYPDAHQKKLAIGSFYEMELYVGLGSGFLEWDKGFERQVLLAQAACGFTRTKIVKIDLLGNSERYYNRQVKTWWY
ncbi:hypothetical protein PHMEG_00018618 [Phytophthora megakarya]|uniref:Uncharacterized protein n=1 Tax=Phytophthora megakarya TaxID=4795 RepID=A0A225VTZ5_9STRA|nr:hypothetical protein PHMEG_00018618 [Phytophthora megakarya]